MTEEQKRALIKKLGAKINTAFDSRYSEDNRKWFVGKIIDSLLAQGVPDANIEQRTKDIIIAAGAALKARIKKGFTSSNLADKWALYDQLKSRTQIIYGLIAMHPEFRDAANADYFDFILERRFRAIQRMAFYVNPKESRNIFDYPGADVDIPDKMKVNKDSETLWDRIVYMDTSGTGPGQSVILALPLILNNSGKTNPADTVEKLFKTNKGADRNLLSCDPVITVLLMDGLRAAKDPNKLLNALIAQGDHYFKIDHPMGHVANALNRRKLAFGQRLVAVTSAFASAGNSAEIEVGKIGIILSLTPNLTPAQLTVNSFIPFKGPFFMIVRGADQGRFTINEVNPVKRKIRVSNLPKDFAAGAKIYMTRDFSFPFYSTLPFHFITDGRSDKALFEQKTVKSTDLQVGDHLFVINHPLYRMYYPSGAWGGEHSLISEIGIRESGDKTFRSSLFVGGHGLSFNTLLHMADEMVSWINTVLGILQALTALHLDNLKRNGRTSTPKVKFFTRVENTVNMNVFEYNLPYTHKLYREKGKKETLTAGFVIKELASDPKRFQIFNANGKDSTVIPTTPSADVLLQVAFTGNSADDVFAVSKWAAPYFNSQTGRFEAQSLFDKDNKTPILLTFEDLAKSKPFFLTDDNGDAFVTRPFVNFDPTYQTFLKNNGAI